MDKINKTIEYLKAKAAPKYDKKTCGWCARMIRMAVDFGFGVNVDVVPSAKDCVPAYEKVGFKNVFHYPSQDKKEYKAKLGDIAIIHYEPHGHICMKLEKGWASDFIQWDKYGGRIRKEDPPFTIMRYEV